jgi:hypothetical protein
MNILLNFDKALSRFEANKFNSYIKFIELDEVNHYYIINRYSDSTFLRSFPNIANVKNVTIVKTEKDKSWKAYWAFLDSIIEKYSIDRYLVFYLNIMGDHRLGGDTKSEFHYKNSLEDDEYLNRFNIVFHSTRGILTNYYITEIKGIEALHVVSDPHEYDAIKNRFYFYDSPETGLKYLPYVEYGFIFKKDLPIERKTQDFTFGCTVLSKDRAHLSDSLIELQSIKGFNVFVKDKFKKRDNMVNNKIYNEFLCKSKFTLIVPSYDKNHFSSVRFFEALAMKTIPLIHEETQYKIGLQHYPELSKLFDKYVVSMSGIKSLIETIDYESAIKEIYKCPDYVKLSKDLEFYKENFEEFFKYNC